MEAFSLPELLVLSGVLAVLAAMAWSALGTAGSLSSQVQCTQKMVQAGKAALLRAQEHRGLILWKEVRFAPGYSEQMWKTPLLREGYIMEQSAFYCPSLSTPAELLTRQYLGFGMRSADELRHQFPELVSGTYGSPEFQDNGRNAGTVFINPRKIDLPSKFPLLMDSFFSNSAGKTSVYYGLQSTVASLDSRNGVASGVHLRHRGRANVMFADGHLENLGPWELKQAGFVSGFDVSGGTLTF